MTTISFTVPAVPVAQPRAKATAMNGKPRMYEAKKSHPIHDFKASVRQAFSEAHQGPPLDGPVLMTCEFYFPLLKKMRGDITKPKATKPDWDNLGKAVSDALNKLAYHDDGQIVQCVIRKSFTSRHHQPRVCVVLSQIDEFGNP